ncbi:hypothetical protein LAG90_16350 [Marinilongibacter aquaticus]|uniref:hypothetical protein n=1 Tax=Marinilongibacter aquaticus TaxID=2975157 RepID=UPI0021BDC892|nr:hypothetical protein [Marinilongibacter aquaticus]UBM58376.1 hypothetical protein LAG90_16350 [Marinilongibacter aquaticus]
MILIKGVRLPKIRAIALFPFVLTRDRKVSKRLLNHENIHLRQQLEMLVLLFYLWYVVEWAIHYVRLGNFWAAYARISFEREAYAKENEPTYLKSRPFWAFLAWL